MSGGFDLLARLEARDSGPATTPPAPQQPNNGGGIGGARGGFDLLARLEARDRLVGITAGFDDLGNMPERQFDGLFDFPLVRLAPAIRLRFGLGDLDLDLDLVESCPCRASSRARHAF